MLFSQEKHKTYEDHVQKKIYGIFLFPICIPPSFFFLSWIHLLLRLILERACVHDDSVNHFALESSQCILSPITISFSFSMLTLTLFLYRCLCICVHFSALTSLHFLLFFLLFSISIFA